MYGIVDIWAVRSNGKDFPVLCELNFFFSRAIKLSIQYRLLSLPIGLLYSSESNENWNGIQIMIMELKRRGAEGIYSFSIFLLQILNAITRLWRWEHLCNFCKTPSAGSIFCKPVGPEYEKRQRKKNNLVKVMLSYTVPLLKCQTFFGFPGALFLRN